MPRSRARSLSIGAPILAVSARFRLRCIHFLFDSCSHTRRAHRSAPPGRRPIRQSTCRAFSGHWVQTSRFIAAVTGEPLPRLPQAALAASIGRAALAQHAPAVMMCACAHPPPTLLSPLQRHPPRSAECSSSGGKESAVSGFCIVLANSPGEHPSNGRQ